MAEPELSAGRLTLLELKQIAVGRREGRRVAVEFCAGG